MHSDSLECPSLERFAGILNKPSLSIVACPRTAWTVSDGAFGARLGDRRLQVFLEDHKHILSVSLQLNRLIDKTKPLRIHKAPRLHPVQVHAAREVVAIEDGFVFPWLFGFVHERLDFATENVIDGKSHL